MHKQYARFYGISRLKLHTSLNSAARCQFTSGAASRLHETISNALSGVPGIHRELGVKLMKSAGDGAAALSCAALPSA